MFNWTKSKNPPAVQQNQGEISKKDQLILEAMGHAKNAREAIGEETLAKLRSLMEKQQQAQKTPEQKAKEAIRSLAPEAVAAVENSPMEQAKKILQSMEPEKLAQHLRLLREYDKSN
ncbi:MAG: hypothetical protein DI586_03065 [Micavibrio aeruginosavorus]|uniref:Uncharacterized protein n=1 Tax=Micavibrio aeruginosavorus TaxID=349221 RepID=A0A2W5HEQ0_9BACT|nr:MAG: hypothetical protein DI586_03065 [Micavibrio aeruginosavorus]